MANSAYTYDSIPQEDEEWRPALGWEGYYEVSSYGRVRSLDRYVEYESRYGTVCMSLKGKMLNPHVSKGYPFVRLSNSERRRMVGLHVLVCEAFLGSRPTGCDAAHNDGNPLNPRLDNLRWATRQENMADCARHGTRVFGERHGRSKLTKEQAATIRVTWDVAELRRLAAEYGIHINHAHQIRRGSRYQTETR